MVQVSSCPPQSSPLPDPWATSRSLLSGCHETAGQEENISGGDRNGNSWVPSQHCIVDEQPAPTQISWHYTSHWQNEASCCCWAEGLLCSTCCTLCFKLYGATFRATGNVWPCLLSCHKAWITPAKFLSCRKRQCMPPSLKASSSAFITGTAVSMPVWSGRPTSDYLL